MTPFRPSVRIVERWLVPTLLVLLSACGGSSGAQKTHLLVFAAASLTDAFDEVASAYEGAHPTADVEVSYAASSALREQILEGAPADVYASADPATMAEVVEAGMVAGTPRLFARNGMQIAVPVGNPAGIAGLDDLSRPDLLIGLCAPQVPCGILGREVLAEAGVVAAIDTEEPNVRALLTKIEAGELDAGLVYRTDVVSSAGVVGIDVPPGFAVEARYPIAVLNGSGQAREAEAFVAFVLSEGGREILAAHGFEAP
jgi:molybdate transport system substrate-binding protein